MRGGLALAGLLALAGCSSSLDSSSRSGLAVAASTSASSVAPWLVVTSPAPGAWVAGPDVTVEGRVRIPGKTIMKVEIAGAPAALEASGAFKGVAHLAERGVQTVSVRAVDLAGADYFTHVSYVRGPFATGEVDDACTLVLEQPALVPANGILADELRTIDFQALLRSVSPLPITVVKNVITIDLDFVNVSHAPVTASLAFGNGTFDVQAEFTQISIDAVVHDHGGLVALTIPITAKANAARATASASVVVSPTGPAKCALTPPVVAIDALTIDTHGALTNVLASLLRAKIESLLEAEIKDVIARKVPQILDKELALLDTPPPVTVNKQVLDLSLRVKTASITPAGCTFALAGDIAPGFSGAASEWVARGGTPPSIGGPAKAVKLALSQDVFAKALTALWRAGSMDVDIAPSATASSSALPLDGAALAKLVPELAGVVPATTPLVIKVRPRCPPELRIGAAPDSYRLVVGELRLEVHADRGGALEKLLELSVHADVPVDVSMNQNVLSVKPGPKRARFLFAVVWQKVRVDEWRLATRLSVVADAMLPQAFTSLASVALPTILNRSVTDGELSVPAPGFDHLLVGASLR